MYIEQSVMAYGIEQDMIRAMLPDGYRSLRPVLRINTEIRDNREVYVEFNTPVEAQGRRGWLNIDNWDSTINEISFEKLKTKEQDDSIRETVRISSPFLEIEYTGTALEGGCPAEKDNDGCFFLGETTGFRPAEKISENKEFCDYAFAWKFHDGDASGKSEGRTIPAFDTPVRKQYDKQPFTAENAAAIPCRQVLGAYIVRFTR